MSDCPCCSGQAYEQCCEPLLLGHTQAATAEALMRSRYTAYARGEFDHLARSLAPEALAGYDRAQAEEWSSGAEWLGLEVRRTSLDDEDHGQVEFVAHYKLQNKPLYHHELASFRRVDGAWAYVDGVVDPKPIPRAALFCSSTKRA